jgi:predicted ribosome-associated RNA-binding protein Tma20
MAVAEDQVMAVAEDQVMAAGIVEMDLQEINTKEKEVHVHHTEDKIVTQRKSGNLTLKDKD